MDSGGQSLFNQSNTLLSGGTSADGDGFVLQLGYFTTSTANFTGTFVPLTGEGSLNTATITNSSPAEPYNKTSIGDITAEGGVNGQFFLPGLNFVAGDPLSGNSLPTAGTQLAIRFYNNTTIGTSSFFNTVTQSQWIWTTPATPPSVVNISLSDSNLVWESIANFGGPPESAFHTTIPIPEPSTLALLSMGVAVPVVVRLRRRASRV